MSLLLRRCEDFAPHSSGALLLDLFPTPMPNVTALRFNCSSALGGSAPSRFTNAAGECFGIPPNESFPCWTGGEGPFVRSQRVDRHHPNPSHHPTAPPWPQLLCPLVASSNCSAATSQWEAPDNGPWTTADSSGISTTQVVNVDCDTCNIGTHAKLIAGVHYASPLAWDAANGQIQVVACPGMCLTNGIAPGALPSCAGDEPFLPVQVHVDNCSAASTKGWARSTVGPSPVDINATVAAFGAFLQVNW